MWAHNKEARHKPTPNHGIETQIMSRYNTDPACICNRCNKGFASEKSAGLHKQSCRKKVNPARIRTTKYTCKKCGKATILKSAALRHFKKCRKGTWTGGIQPNDLGNAKDKHPVQHGALPRAQNSHEVIQQNLPHIR